MTVCVDFTEATSTSGSFVLQANFLGAMGKKRNQVVATDVKLLNL